MYTCLDNNGDDGGGDGDDDDDDDDDEVEDVGESPTAPSQYSPNTASTHCMAMSATVTIKKSVPVQLRRNRRSTRDGDAAVGDGLY